MQIPWQQLTPETVTAILEEFATRAGTDYGHEQYTLAQKVAMLRRQLERGDVAISFDSQTETCSLITLR